MHFRDKTIVDNSNVSEYYVVHGKVSLKDTHVVASFTQVLTVLEVKVYRKVQRAGHGSRTIDFIRELRRELKVGLVDHWC